MEKIDYSFLKNIKIKKDLPINILERDTVDKDTSEIEFFLNINGIKTLEDLFLADNEKEIYYYPSVYKIKNRKALEGMAELLKYHYLNEPLPNEFAIDTIILNSIQSFYEDSEKIGRVGFTEREIDILRKFVKNTFSTYPNSEVFSISLSLDDVLEAFTNYINHVYELSKTTNVEVLPLSEIDNEKTLISPEIRNILYKYKKIKEYQNAIQYDNERTIKKWV